MKIKLDKKYLEYSLYAFLTIALSIIFYLSLGNLHSLLQSISIYVRNIRRILSPFFIAIFIAYLLNPGVRWFEINVYNKIDRVKVVKKLPRILSILTIYLFLFGLLTIIIFFVVPQIGRNITEISRKVQEYINSTVRIANEWFDKWSGQLGQVNNIYNFTGHIEKNINEIFIKSSKFLDYIFNNIVMAIMNITSRIFNFILGIIISFYLLGSKESFKKGTERVLRSVFNEKTVDKLKELGREADTIFGKFVIGKFLDSLIIGIICFIGLAIIKVKYALLLGAIVGTTNMIPYFGPFIGAIPAVIITYFDNPINALWVAIFILLLQQFDGLILGPKILGDSVGLSPFWIILSIVLGGGLYGVLGMFLGVPIGAIIITFINKLIDWQLERKNVKVYEDNIE